MYLARGGRSDPTDFYLSSSVPETNPTLPSTPLFPVSSMKEEACENDLHRRSPGDTESVATEY